MTGQGSPATKFKRAVAARNLFLAETHAFEMTTLSLEDALALVVLYAEAEDDKFERAGVRWLGRLLTSSPMPLSLAAQSVELVAQLRGPDAERVAGALGALARLGATPSRPSW